MRTLLGLGLSAFEVFACGGPTEAVGPTPPATTARVASATPPPPVDAPAPPETPPAPPPCGGKCPGHVGPALVDAIAKRAKQAHRCYDKALATDSTLRGKVTVRMMIGADGRVCEVSADSETKAMDSVASCVAGFYRTTSGDAQFPPPENGCVLVNAPVNFIPRGADAGGP